MTKHFTSIDVIRRDNTRALMKEMKLTRAEFSETVKVSYPLLGHYIGKTPTKSIGDEVARRIEKHTNKPEYWLDHDHSLDTNKNNIEDLRDKIGSMQSDSRLRVDDSILPSNTTFTDTAFDTEYDLPVISWVAAGSFSDVMPVTIDDAIDWIPKPRTLSNKAFGLIIEGRSMWPEFKPGEIIFVEPKVDVWELKDGDLVVIQCESDTQATFKQLVIGDSPEDMYLRPLNPDWPDQEMRPMTECTLVGKVKGKYTAY